MTDYEQKTISIARSKDRFRNIQALQHEVFHAALWERDFRDDSEQWDLHAWIYFTEGVFPLLLHDNPEFVKIRDGRMNDLTCTRPKHNLIGLSSKYPCRTELILNTPSLGNNR